MATIQYWPGNKPARRYSPRSLVASVPTLSRVDFPGFFFCATTRDARHRIAIFVRDASADDRRGQHSKQQVFHRLPSLHRENVDVRFEPVLIYPDKPGSLDEDTVTPGHDVLDVEMAVGVGRGGVVSAFFLIFRDDLHQYFFERLAPRFLYYRACNGGGAVRRGCGLLRARKAEGAEDEKGEDE